MLYVIVILLLILVLAIPAARNILLGLVGGSLVLAVIGVVVAAIVFLAIMVFSSEKYAFGAMILCVVFAVIWYDQRNMNEKLKAKYQREPDEE